MSREVPWPNGSSAEVKVQDGNPGGPGQCFLNACTRLQEVWLADIITQPSSLSASFLTTGRWNAMAQTIMRETFDRQVTEADNTKQGIFIVIVTDALFYTVSLLTWISPHICSSQWIDCSMKVVLIISNFLLKKWKSRNQFPPLQAHSQISSLSPVCKSIFCLIVIVYMCYRMRA